MGFRMDTLGFRGFRSLRGTEVHLGGLNVLVGANGAGKSNLLAGFDLLQAIASGGLQEFVGQHGGAHCILHQGVRQLQVSGTMGPTTYTAQIASTDEDALVFLDEKFSIGKTRWLASYPGTLSRHRAESSLRDYQGEDQDIVQAFFGGLASIRHWHFADTTPQAPLRQPSQIDDARDLLPAGGNLASVLYRLKQQHRQRFGLLTATLQLVAPFIQELIVEPLNLSPDQVSIQWRQRGVNGLFDAGHLSNGTLRFLALATVLLAPRSPSILIFDEPELGLHPRALVLLVDLLRRTSQGTQIVISTQSRQLIDLLTAEEIRVVERIDGATTLKQLDSITLATWLANYTLGELWEMNVLEALSGSCPRAGTPGR